MFSDLRRTMTYLRSIFRPKRQPMKYKTSTKDLLVQEREAWDQLPTKLRRRAVRHLQNQISDEDKSFLLEFMKRNGNDWPFSDTTPPEQKAKIKEEYDMYLPDIFHMSGGMHTRNLLREVIADKELPGIGGEEGNWDDFYSVALELAVGYVPNE